jgi:hypothetical protein
MYLGDDWSLDVLERMCYCYDLALGTYGLKEFGTYFNARFTDWLSQRFECWGGIGWARIIREHSPSAEAAFFHFFEPYSNSSAAKTA